MYKLYFVMMPFGSLGGSQDTISDCKDLTTTLISDGGPGTNVQRVYTTKVYKLIYLKYNNIDKNLLNILVTQTIFFSPAVNWSCQYTISDSGECQNLNTVISKFLQA